MNQKKAPCTVVLIAVNTAVFLALSVIGMTEDAGFMLQHGAMYAPDILYNGKYYELFTSMFLHFGFQHLMSNMISLGVMGWQLESAIGRIRYLLICKTVIFSHCFFMKQKRSPDTGYILIISPLYKIFH